MDKKLKYTLAGAILSGVLVILLGYYEVLPLVANILKAVYLVFTVSFTICLYRELTQPATSVQPEGE